MLDHVFTDAIGGVRDALEAAFLERLAPDEHFQVDVLLGDVSWETSYGLPGEGTPPRVRADLTLDWPTWAQTAYRGWTLGEELTDPPVIEISVVFRLQRLVDAPDPSIVIVVLPPRSPKIGAEDLYRGAPTMEVLYDDELVPSQYSIEVSYEGSYELTEETLHDGAKLDDHLATLGVWISSMLVRLGDIPLRYGPPTGTG